MILRGNDGLLGSATSLNWGAAIRGNESWDTTRRNHVLYETPTLHGFTVQAAVAEDNYWDVALRYAGEFNGIRVAFGIGYQENSEFNAPATPFGVATTGDLCTTLCDAKATDLKGALSVLHVPTGLFFTGSMGRREVEGTNAAVGSVYTGPDLTYWQIAGGIARNFFGIGNTVLFAEYSQSEGGLEQAAFLGTATGYTLNVAGVRTTSEVTHWGIGVNQYIDAAAMEIFATYKNFSLDATGFTQPTLNTGAGGVHDLSIFMVGTRINF